jgi:hypothetical protein
MAEVSTFRLYLLRATYLIIAAGLGLFIWPLLVQPPAGVEHMRGVVRALLAAVGLLALIGIRYPLRMLPLLFFELTWKTIWVLAIGVPLWKADAFTPGTEETWRDCLVGIVLCLMVIPWGYVKATYVRAPGDRWRSAPPALTPGELEVGRTA